MNNNQFLIPANSKKSMLILSFFNVTDLIIFGSGCVLTFILLMIISSNSVGSAIIILLPAIITGLLVLPVPNQHNVRTFIINVYHYYSNRKTYFWRGWCIRNGK